MRIARLPPSRRVWIFDLDNTLHDARVHIFPSMHTQIQDYLKRQFGLDDEGAGRMRRDFWLRYGTTLAGLMRHHGTDPRHFLAETHVFPELADMVVRENALKHALARLGGTRLVFSNAPRHYVEEVLRALGLRRFFDAVYTIEDTGYRGKPHAWGFHRLLRNHDLDPHRCALIDDILDNLRAAHRLGMSTVWVSPVGRRAPYVDLRVSSVTELPRRILS
ncbi:MAG TPA: pyrimidine 5'-nucleotidase [Burkholderiales bacterium]|nr:pyrimidine 5'-nucleotidase [Burkholderiales bacterium]